MHLAPYFLANAGAMYVAYLMPIQSDGSKGQHRHVNGAVLNKPAYVAHQLSKNPGAADEPHLKDRQHWIKLASTALIEMASIAFTEMASII